MKKIYAELTLKWKYEKDKKKNIIAEFGKNETPKKLQGDNCFDNQIIFGYDIEGNSLVLKYERKPHLKAEIWIILQLKNGEMYTFPTHPKTIVVDVTPQAFEGSGLKMECLVPHNKWRITYSGWMRKGISGASNSSQSDNLHFVKFNFLYVQLKFLLFI